MTLDTAGKLIPLHNCASCKDDPRGVQIGRDQGTVFVPCLVCTTVRPIGAGIAEAASDSPYQLLGCGHYVPRAADAPHRCHRTPN